MTENFTRISISLDSELVADINWVMMKQTGMTETKNSYGQFFFKMLRPIIPYRNAEIEEKNPKIL